MDITPVPAASPAGVERQPEMPYGAAHPTGDDLTTALIPVAERLIDAVHNQDQQGVSMLFIDAAQIAGSHAAATVHLAVLCAAMCSQDHAPGATLGWTFDPAAYHARREHRSSLLSVGRQHLGGAA